MPYLAKSMTACPQFRYSLVANDLTTKLREEEDWITCGFVAEQRLVMGTHNGLVHVLNLQTGVGFTLENHYAILDVHCSNQYLCYTGPSKLGLYDFDNESEVLDYDLEQGQWSRTVDLGDGGTTVVVGTAEELFLLQKGLFRTSKVVLAKVSSQIHSLAVAFPLLGIANGTNATFLLLPQGSVLYQLKDTGKSSIIFLSQDKCAVITASSYQLLSIARLPTGYELVPIRTCRLELDIRAVGGYQQECLLILTSDQTIRLLDVEGKTTFQGKTIRSGLLVSEISKESDAFYIISKDEILKITTYSQAEKLNWYLENNFYDEALQFGQSAQYPKSDIQARILHDLVSKRKSSDARLYLLNLIDQQTITWSKIVETYRNDPFLVCVCEDIPENAMTSEAAESILRKLIADREESVILRCFEKWPEKIAFKSRATEQEMLKSDMIQAKIRFALRKNLANVAMELLLNENSAHLFAVMELHSEAKRDFLRSLSAEKLQKITQIDSEKALKVYIENDWLDTDKVREGMEENLVFEYLSELWKGKKRRNPGSDLHLLRFMLQRKSPFVLDLLTNSTGLNRSRALEVCQEFCHMEGQIVLLQMLNRTEELIAVLKGNFEQGLEYLRRRNSEELWTAVINQGVTCEKQAKTLIPFLYSYAKQTEVIDKLPEGMYLQEVLRLFGSCRQQVEMTKSALGNLSTHIGKAHRDHMAARKRGIYIEEHYLCSICGKTITEKCVFRRCSHHSHKSCNDASCRACSRLRSLPS